MKLIDVPKPLLGEPAWIENSAIENKTLTAAAAKPFLASIDSAGFGWVIIR